MSEMLHRFSAETTDRWLAANNLIARDAGEDGEEDEEDDEQQKEEDDEDEDDGYSE